MTRADCLGLGVLDTFPVFRLMIPQTQQKKIQQTPSIDIDRPSKKTPPKTMEQPPLDGVIISDTSGRVLLCRRSRILDEEIGAHTFDSHMRQSSLEWAIHVVASVLPLWPVGATGAGASMAAASSNSAVSPLVAESPMPGTAPTNNSSASAGDDDSFREGVFKVVPYKHGQIIVYSCLDVESLVFIAVGGDILGELGLAEVVRNMITLCRSATKKAVGAAEGNLLDRISKNYSSICLDVDDLLAEGGLLLSPEKKITLR